MEQKWKNNQTTKRYIKPFKHCKARTSSILTNRTIEKREGISIRFFIKLCTTIKTCLKWFVGFIIIDPRIK